MVESSEAGDRELVLRAMEGDESAFGALVRRYARPAYAVALSVVGRHEDAEDAAQESFLVALDRLEECRDPDRFSGWLLTIVRNRSRNLIRREKLRRGDPIPPGLATSEPGPERRSDRAMLRERLRSGVAQLPAVQREVLLLHDLEGWKHREIAERLEMPPGTVRSHLHFARKRLRTVLAAPQALRTEARTG